MDSRTIVGDNVVVTKSSEHWDRSLGRIALPCGLFIIALPRALCLSEGTVASDRPVMSKAGEIRIVMSDVPT